jgi:hypothetical protein
MVYLSKHTNVGLKNLTVILLADFNTQFKPADVGDKTTYTSRSDVGSRNHYIVVHPYLVVALLLDPRVKGCLGDTDKEADYVVLPGCFEALWLDDVDNIIAYCLEHSICMGTNNTDQATGGVIEKPVVVNATTLDEEELVFGGMKRMKIPPKSAGETDQDVVRLKMEMEIDYLQMPEIELRGRSMGFMDPLLWWEYMEERKRFLILSQMTKAFLVILATLASSERMWSCSGKTVSAKTAMLKMNVTSATMSVTENTEVLRKHYKEVVKTVNDPTPLYLPEAVKQASAVGMDVGQDLF